MEVSAVLINLIDERSSSPSENLLAGDIKRVVTDALNDISARGVAAVRGDVRRAETEEARGRSYASVTGSSRSEVRVSRDPTVELSNTTSFLVVPKDDMKDRFTLSQATKETLCNVFKPADCGLKVKRLIHARDSGVRIEAFSSDIEKSRPWSCQNWTYDM